VTWQDLVAQAQKILDEKLAGTGTKRQIVALDPEKEEQRQRQEAAKIAALEAARVAVEEQLRAATAERDRQVAQNADLMARLAAEQQRPIKVEVTVQPAPLEIHQDGTVSRVVPKTIAPLHQEARSYTNGHATADE
jgi:hypothetical protein